MKIIIFLSLITLIFSDCTKSQISYEGRCLSSCTEVNKVYYETNKVCVDLCKSYGFYRNSNYKCVSSCSGSNRKIINTNHLDDFCAYTDCLIFGQNFEANSIKCYDGCKNNGFQMHVNYVYQCGNCKYNIYEEEPDETYCFSDCGVYGFYTYNKKCVKSCKVLGKYYYDGKCVDSCPNRYKYITSEENYCTQDCNYHNMIGASGTCVESCYSIGEYLGVENVCQQTSISRTFTYKGENYVNNDCELFGLVKGPSSNCVENCKKIGKVRRTDICYDKCNYNGATQPYQYEYEDEIYCLSNEQCQNIGKYPKIQNGQYYCSDECSGTNCILNCGEGRYYSIPGSQCVNSCRENGLYLYDKFCINKCPIISKYIYNGPKEDICISQCPEDAPFSDYSTNKCLESCNEMPIFDNMCVNSCPKAAPYINTIGNNKFCVKDCNSLGLYNVLSEKICTDNCKKNSKYLIEGNCIDKCISEYPSIYLSENENHCIKKCSDVGLITDISDGSCVTNCKNLGKIRYEDRCITKCPFNVKYTYSTNEENYCVKSCIPYGQVPNDLICAESTCKKLGKTQVNGVCVTCTAGVAYRVIGIEEDFCTPDCAEYGLVANYQTNQCQSVDISCSSGTFKNMISKSCVNKCPEKINFVQDSFCVKNCEKFFYEDENHNKICTESCSGNHPYMIINTKQCVSSCNSINNYQLNGYNICYSKCNELSVIPKNTIYTKNIFSSCVQKCMNDDNTKNEQDCTNDCLRPFKFADNINRKCYQSCKDATKYEYKDKNGNYLCVDNCKSINKIRDENKCVNQCPFNKKIKYELNGDIICDENCPNNMHMKYDSLSSQYSCVTNCKDNNLFLDGNKCVEQCPSTRDYIISKNNDIICSISCDNNYKYINENKGHKFCVNNCKAQGKVLYNGKCVEICPENKDIDIDKNDDIECSDGCEEGQYISIKYNKKYCVDDCSESNQFLYDGKCISECPEGKYLYEDSDSNKQCIDDCQVYNLYSNDKKCVPNCEQYNLFAYQGKCLFECPKGKYLYEDISTGKTQCIDDCNSHNLYLNNNKCVTDCKIFNKISFEGNCISECPDEFPYTLNNICKSDPCEEGKFYDSFTNKCYDKCDSTSNYLDTETNYCIKNCKSKNSNKIYSIYENKCISNCNELNKYIYLYKDNYYCLENCEESDLLISSDGKFCVERCDSNAPYMKNNKCTSSCGDWFIDFNKKCVEKCPNNNPYIYNNECIESCYDNYLYILYDTNICVEKCTNNLVLNSINKNAYYKQNYENCLETEGNDEDICNRPFYLSDKENLICYQDCNQSLITKYVYNNDECVGYCKNGIKEDNICNDEIKENDYNDKCQQNKSSGMFIYINYLIYFINFILFLS